MSKIDISCNYTSYVYDVWKVHLCNNIFMCINLLKMFLYGILHNIILQSHQQGNIQKFVGKLRDCYRVENYSCKQN